MKKAIPILLVVFLCLLVAFSAVCEYRQQHPVPEEMLVSFESHGKCWFKNAEGETLECEGTNYSGDMQVDRWFQRFIFFSDSSVQQKARGFP